MSLSSGGSTWWSHLLPQSCLKTDLALGSPYLSSHTAALLVQCGGFRQLHGSGVAADWLKTKNLCQTLSRS